VRSGEGSEAAHPTSAAKPCAGVWGCAEVRAATVASTSAAVRALTNTVAPRLASSCAVARPMPLVPPVTSTR
jgi:hypothetical protein